MSLGRWRGAALVLSLSAVTLGAPRPPSPAEDPSACARARPWLLRRLGRAELRLGLHERAAQHLEEAAALEHAAGRRAEATDDRLAAAFTAIVHLRRFDRARAALGALDPPAALERDHPRGAARAPYYRGLLALETGDLRAALPLLRDAATRAERLGLGQLGADAAAMEAEALSQLGRHAEAAARLAGARAALGPEADPCARAHLATNAGWMALRARGARPADPIAPLEEAADLYREACPAPADRANALTNLALAELDRGRPEAARRRLAEARSEEPRPDPRIHAWQLLAEARIDLAEGRGGAALAASARLAALGELERSPEIGFEAALTRAEALEALGRAGDAIAAYAGADAALDAWSRLAPLGEGRETLLARHERAARLRVGALLDAGRAAEAAAVARRSRARLLAALRWLERPAALAPDARARWDRALGAYREARAALEARAAEDAWLPADQLEAAARARAGEHARLRAALDEALAALGPDPGAGPPPEPLPGELTLVLHPVREGWAAFAVEPDHVTAARLGDIDPGAAPAALAARILEPLRAPLTRAERVRVAAYGPLDALPLHALPWDGAPLGAARPVAYAVDAGAAPAAPPAPSGGPAAVVVADPRGDLPGARREADRVEAALRGAGWSVRRLAGDAATHAAVIAALEDPGVTLFHHAGHALHGGRDGWESRLALAGGGDLTVGDVLTLARVPARIVLSGCDTARTTPEARAEGLGLAQAFVIAGAAEVVAASRPLDDRRAPGMMEALHTHLAAGARAEGALLAARDGADGDEGGGAEELWASLRVLVP